MFITTSIEIPVVYSVIENVYRIQFSCTLIFYSDICYNHNQIYKALEIDGHEDNHENYMPIKFQKMTDS